MNWLQTPKSLKTSLAVAGLSLAPAVAAAHPGHVGGHPHGAAADAMAGGLAVIAALGVAYALWLGVSALRRSRD